MIHTELTVWKVIWLIGLAYIIGWEIIALARPQRGDTLSEFIWWLQGIHPLIRFQIGSFLLWLLIHLTTDGRV